MVCSNPKYPKCWWILLPILPILSSKILVNDFSITPFPGWWFQSLWKIWKSVGMIIPNLWENKKSSKPPTSFYLWGGSSSIILSHLSTRPLALPQGTLGVAAEADLWTSWSRFWANKNMFKKPLLSSIFEVLNPNFHLLFLLLYASICFYMLLYPRIHVWNIYLHWPLK